jgi:hypothetical protein
MNKCFEDDDSFVKGDSITDEEGATWKPDGDILLVNSMIRGTMLKNNITN